jgi:hypothetical protein
MLAVRLQRVACVPSAAEARLRLAGSPPHPVDGRVEVTRPTGQALLVRAALHVARNLSPAGTQQQHQAAADGQTVMGLFNAAQRSLVCVSWHDRRCW